MGVRPINSRPYDCLLKHRSRRKQRQAHIDYKKTVDLLDRPSLSRKLMATGIIGNVIDAGA